MLSEEKIREAIKYHKDCAMLKGCTPSAYNYHIGAIAAYNAVLEEA